MVDSILYDRAIHIMNKALSISSERNQLISNNIANVDTVGFKPTDLNFRKSLERAMDSAATNPMTRTHEKHYSYGPGLGSGDPAYEQSDMEAVDIDKEMTNLAENNLQYRTDSEMLIRKINLIRYSITEGGK